MRHEGQQPIHDEDTSGRPDAQITLQESEAAARQDRVWLTAQKEAFQAAMNGAPLQDALDILVRTAVEQAESQCRCAFYIADAEGRELTHLVGMSDDYAQCVDGFRISPDSVACGLAVSQGQPVITPDVRSEPRWQPWLWLAEKFDYRGCWSFPVETATGKRVGSFALYFKEPRELTPRFRELAAALTQTAGIIISRFHAEAASRESEARFRQFAEASSQALWIRDAGSLAMEYVSPAIEMIYGVGPDAFLGELKRWAATIVPEDRDLALEHIQCARRGEIVVHEFRIQRPSDLAFRWIRSTDFPLRDSAGRVQRIGGIAEDVTEAKAAIEHQDVLLSELQHRVRNIMAIMQSIAARTGETASSVAEYAERMNGRLWTLSRVQTLLTRAANIGVGVATIVREEIAAQAEHGEQYTITGPDVLLSPKAAEVLTLALHELSTNALKYGALSSSAGGHVDVIWKVVRKRGVSWLCFDWTESGGPARIESGPRRVGFGSELIEGRIPYELGGSGSLEIGQDGVQCHLEFPLQDGASILETDAPQPAVIFGGAIDIAGQADLRGHRILVAEDDYYLAADTARALRGAGAKVIGPCPAEDLALKAIEDDAPSGAIVDINLGSGPSFALAERLKRDGVPFVFITGYDAKTIPADFADVPRLQKPLDLKRTVSALAEILPSRKREARV